MIRKILGIMLFVLTAPALAGDLSYNYIEVGYQNVEIDDVGFGSSIDGDGFLVRGSFEVGDNWFVGAGYSQANFDFNIDYDEMSLGLGYHAPISERADVFASLSFVRAEASIEGFEPQKEDGYGLSVGVRGMATENVELAASVGYVDLGDGADGTAFALGALYNFTDNFAVGVEVDLDEDATAYGLGARFYFGN